MDGIYIEYSGYPVDVGGGFRLPLGHGAVIAVDPASGRTQYFEYGRYGGDFGQVMQRTVPDVVIGHDGRPTPESLKKLYDFVSAKYGRSRPVVPEYHRDADFQKIVDFARQRMNDPNRAPYSWNPLHPNHCFSFAHEAIEAGRQSTVAPRR